jgi:hypothetical protein
MYEQWNYIKVAAAVDSGGAQEKGKREWNSVYDQNWWEKPVWVPVISLC